MAVGVCEREKSRRNGDSAGTFLLFLSYEKGEAEGMWRKETSRIRDGCLLPSDRRQRRIKTSWGLVGEPEGERDDEVERDCKAREKSATAGVVEITRVTH